MLHKMNKLHLPIGLGIGYFLKGQSQYNPGFNFGGEKEVISDLNCNKIDLGIPIGIEFNIYKKWNLDVNYYIGLIDIFDDIKSKNRSLNIIFKYNLS